MRRSSYALIAATALVAVLVGVIIYLVREEGIHGFVPGVRADRVNGYADERT